MKVSFPLSLKISLWMVLNLLLLGAAGAGFFVVQGGLGWESLVRGAAGAHAQALANLMAGEASASPPGVRDAVLVRFGLAQHADIFVFHNDGDQIAGPRVALPAAVVAKLTEGAHNQEPSEARPPRDDLGPPGGEPPPSRRANPPPPGPGQEDSARGRFLVRAGPVAEFWVGLRVPFPDPRGNRSARTTVIVRVTSLRGLVALLDLMPWLLGATAALVLSFLFWLPLVRGITRALRQLTAATEKIAEGKFDTRVPATRSDEIGRLGESVNTMAVRLDTLVHGQKRFLGDIAHELCSPLARLQMAVGILEERAAPEQRATVADVRDELQQMSALVNELLAFSKAGLRPRDAALATVELASLVARVLAREDAEKKVRVAIPAGLRALADEELLARALGNLVRNALRYAGDTGPVVISAREEAGEILLTVADEGPGVPAGALTRLGEPFYRPDFARTRETGGAGLGLAIVKSCAAACRGTAVFRNRTPRGFEAELRLHRCADSPPSSP